MKNKIIIFGIFVFLSLSIVNFAVAADVKYCCERTIYGAWCQNAPKEQCNLNFKSSPSSCEAVSYCRQGCCFDSTEGSCMENTPQRVCQDSGGTWSEGKECQIPQCQQGCCVLGSQAAFVTQTRCKKLSSFYGLLIDFRNNVNDEISCLSLAGGQDEGACVYDLDYAKTCKFTTRQGCNSIKESMKIDNGTITGNVEFFKDVLCSADELETNCGPTKQTTCVDGKDEVYFVDLCGNIANIYDSSKINDKAYWNKKISKTESCQKQNKDCGNCDYFAGSVCKEAKKTKINPAYGDYACSNLNCASTSLNKPMKHGESWCETDSYLGSVGQRYYRHICMNGEELVEPCADYKQEVCLQDAIASGGVSFSQAACRINRWQDCLAQQDQQDCENGDKRDCKWISTGMITNQSKYVTFNCTDKYPAGLKFWDESATKVCSQGAMKCEVSYEKKIGGGWKCSKNCDCLKDEWKNNAFARCEGIGDCGAKVNFVGTKGVDNYVKIEEDIESDSAGKLGGIF